jgi:hypothetical protein
MSLSEVEMVLATPRPIPIMAPACVRSTSGWLPGKVTCHRPHLSRVNRQDLAASTLSHGTVSRTRTLPIWGTRTHLAEATFRDFGPWWSGGNICHARKGGK